MQSRNNTTIAYGAGDAILTCCDEADVASVACRIFGADAALAVAFSAIDARLDSRDRDFRFWAAVFHTLTRE